MASSRLGAMMFEPTSFLGKSFGKYRFERILGQGAMAIVFQGMQLDFHSPVAIKMLLPEYVRSEERRLRFRREGQVQFRLTHPNIVRVIDLIEEEALFCIVMDWIDGQSLADFLEVREEALAPCDVWRLFLPILEAMEFAHGHGVIHRDIKPENILLEGDEGREVPKLLDFGVAKFLMDESFKTKPSSMIGTPSFLAPELAGQGEQADERVDIYALGVLLFLLLTGRHPFEADNPMEMIGAHLFREIPSVRPLLVGAPASLDGLLQMAMAKRREERFANCNAFRLALRQVFLEWFMSEPTLQQGERAGWFLRSLQGDNFEVLLPTGNVATFRSTPPPESVSSTTKDLQADLGIEAKQAESYSGRTSEASVKRPLPNVRETKMLGRVEASGSVRVQTPTTRLTPTNTPALLSGTGSFDNLPTTPFPTGGFATLGHETPPTKNHIWPWMLATSILMVFSVGIGFVLFPVFVGDLENKEGTTPQVRKLSQTGLEPRSKQVDGVSQKTQSGLPLHSLKQGKKGSVVGVQATRERRAKQRWGEGKRPFQRAPAIRIEPPNMRGGRSRVYLSRRRQKAKVSRSSPNRRLFKMAKLAPPKPNKRRRAVLSQSCVSCVRRFFLRQRADAALRSGMMRYHGICSGADFVQAGQRCATSCRSFLPYCRAFLQIPFRQEGSQLRRQPGRRIVRCRSIVKRGHWLRQLRGVYGGSAEYQQTSLCLQRP